MISLSMLFTFNPWPSTIQNIIDMFCTFSVAILLACTSFHVQDIGESQVELKIAVGSLLCPLVVAGLCMAFPLYHFAIRRTRSIRSYRLGQSLRDLVLIITRQTNNEMNGFITSLDDADRMTIVKAMDVF